MLLVSLAIHCLLYLLQEMYSNIETNDEGDICMKTVIEHIKAVEAGSGSNIWVNQRLKELLETQREVAHVELDEFLVRNTINIKKS